MLQFYKKNKHPYMTHYIVKNGGLIKTEILSNGDMSIEHTNSNLGDFISLICAAGRGHWNPTYRHWVVFAHSIDEAIRQIETIATRNDYNGMP